MSKAEVRTGFGLKLIFSMLLLTAIGLAQNSSVANGKLTGVVVDPGGATLPKARVMLVNLKSLGTQTVVVPLDGKFSFENLRQGDYAVIVVGPSDPYGACWSPAIRQVTLNAERPIDLRIQILLDTRCGKGVDN